MSTETALGKRKVQDIPEEVQVFIDPSSSYNCDSCSRDLTHSIRIKCADPACQSEEGVDICPGCFCAGKEFKNHKRWHSYRVIEMHSYPIFTEDWGADEEIQLITGIQMYGIGNWKKIAEHVGTRTSEEVAAHYKEVYVNSSEWPRPKMDIEFKVDPYDFQARKRRRITEMNKIQRPVPGPAPTSAPGIHEIQTFLPGRLEFEHELDNDAEDLVKDLEFGVVMQYGGDLIPEDEDDPDVKARKKWEEDKLLGLHECSDSTPGPSSSNGNLNGYHTNGVVVKKEAKSDDVTMANGDEEEEPTVVQPYETEDSLEFKLTLLEMYYQRVEKRLEAKSFMFDRGLMDYKKMQAAEKKRPKEDREFIHRLRPFARLQTSADYEAFTTDMLYEAILRKRIRELQGYRQLGLCSSADVEKYESDVTKRAQAKREYTSVDRRRDESREPTPRAGPTNNPLIRKTPAPLNLANSPSLHLLTPAEQTLCSSLRILPKPYLVIKETLVREYARRGGKLRRREARDLVKIDVNKTSRIWDFLVRAGYLEIATGTTGDGSAAGADASRQSSLAVNGSPQKDAAANSKSPKPSNILPPGPSQPLGPPPVPWPGSSS